MSLSYNVQSKYYTGSIPIIDLSWYTPFKPYGDVIITAFTYLFFIWRVFIHTPNIIHGLGGEASGVSANIVKRGSDKK